MRIDWVPYSASALVAGATALSVGALLLPTGQETSETLRIADEKGALWFAVSLLFFLASVALTVGVPAILTLFDGRGSRLGLIAVSMFTVGAIGTAGYAMLLAFIRALVKEDAISGHSLDTITQDTGLAIFLYGWIAFFVLGELLLAIALLVARSTPRWIPLLLIAHVAMVPLGSFLPEDLEPMSALLLTIGLSGIGINAVSQREARMSNWVGALPR